MRVAPLPAGRRTPGGRALLTLTALTVCALTLAACSQDDPLQAVRDQQARGDFAGSLEPLRELLRERAGDPEVQFLYGRALVATGQPSLAEWSLREAMDDPEWLVPAGLQLIHATLRAQNLDVAIEAADRLLEAEPDNVDVLLMRANAFAHSRRHPERALEDAERVLELDPDRVEAFEPRILALLALERVDEAREAIETLGRRIEETGAGEGSQGWHCATAAIFADESGEEERAEALFADCVERFPAHPNVVSSALQFYDARKQSERALDVLRRAQEEDPESRHYRVLLADRLRLAGRGDAAEALLREATDAEDPGRASAAWLDLVKHHQDVEQYQQAADAAERALALAREADAPISPQLQLEYADALVIAGRLEPAAAFVEEMTVPAHRAMIRARIAQEDGRPEEALELFDEAFRLWPDNPWARYFAALAAESVGDFERAIQAYRYSIRIDPDATDARSRLGRLHLAEGRVAMAQTILTQAAASASRLTLEARLLLARVLGWTGDLEALRRLLNGMGQVSASLQSEAVAAAMESAAEARGSEGALELLDALRSQDLDLRDPVLAPVLRALVWFSARAGRLEGVKSTVEGAVEAHPDVADLHEIRGLMRDLAGDRDGARAAYERALALDPENVQALESLGRLQLAAGDAEAAVATLERALALDPDRPGAGRAAAEALVALGRAGEAEVLLESLLRASPYDGETASQLAELHLAGGTATDRTLDLARRAIRFGGDAEALDLLSRVHAQRGEPDLAGRAAERAQALRERDPQGEG